MSNREGFISGALAGALVATLIRPKAQATEIKSNKLVINQQTLNPNATATLLSEKSFKFAVLLIHGNGDQQVQLTVVEGSNRYMVNGNEQAIGLIANQTLSITATNTDATATHLTPTIEIIYLEW